MIKNDLELEITNEKLQGFLSTIELIDMDPTSTQLSPKKQEIYLNALKGEVENLQEQIYNYETLKRGVIENFTLNHVKDLPVALISHRISKGYTQLDLANRLGITEEELVRHERNLFEDAAPELVAKIIEQLDIEVPGSLIRIFKQNLKQVLSVLRRNLRPIYKSLLPDELNEQYNLSNGYIKLYMNLKRTFGEQSLKIFSGEDISFEQLATVRYKLPKSANAETVYTYTSFASRIARIISTTINPSNIELPTDSIQFKTNVIEKYKEFNLVSCVNYLWDLGIPVIPLKASGGFHGAFWRFNGINVIILKQKSNSNAKWLFDVLHEYWHATQDPLLSERDVVDITETLLHLNEDQEEIDANNFANGVIFDGRAAELLASCYGLTGKKISHLKNNVIRVAAFNKIDVSSLANLVAYDMSTKNKTWWGAAQNLQATDNPFSIVLEILSERLKIEEIDNMLDKEFILKNLFEE